MGEEIFGPILPVLTYTDLDAAPGRHRGPAPSAGPLPLQRGQGRAAQGAGPLPLRRRLPERHHHPSGPPALCPSAAWARAAWAAITARPASRPSVICAASWTRKPGWTCRCATSPTPSRRTRCCGSSCSDFALKPQNHPLRVPVARGGFLPFFPGIPPAFAALTLRVSRAKLFLY